MWTYRVEMEVAPATDTVDLTGYGVEALDGSIGKMDEATYEAGSSYLVIDTGPWIFGQKVLFPARVVTDIANAQRFSVTAGSPPKPTLRGCRPPRPAPTFDAGGLLSARPKPS